MCVLANSLVYVYAQASCMRAMQVKHLCIAKINADHSNSFSLALLSLLQFLRTCSFIVQLVNYAIVIAIRECTARVRVRVRVRVIHKLLARAVIKLLVSGTV